ncbi:YqaJ viral recombinase family protein [Campylobacter sp. CX2-4080-23]|uniref:lambda-exonuclease family protein n=1 Tax=Campylobacter porcelli TaxID=1660073 RepID=UPI002E9CF2DC|nr:YqaJ viral recombinase family protein [Campylobacter sp. CX2-4080-23]
MIVDLIQGSHEWLEYRKSKFNASETPSILGIGFNKPYQIALIKKGKFKPFISEAMRQGNQYEPMIREQINQKYNLELEPVVMVSDDDDRFLASLDGADLDKKVFCEIKFSKNEFEYVKANDKPSDKYYYQIQHQFYVSNLDLCVYAVGYINDDFDLEIYTITIERDDKAIDKIKKAWNDFEQDYLNIEISSEWADIASQISALNDEKKAIENQLDELKKQAINKADGKEFSAFGITIYKTTRKTADYKAFLSDNNLEIPDKYYKESCSWSVRVAN